MRQALTRVVAVLATSLGLLAGGTIAASQPAQAAAETAIRERVLAYWNARVRKDYRAEWELLEPRLRARTSPDEYGRGRSVEYLAAQVEGVEQRGNFARVTVRLAIRFAHPLAPGRSHTDSTALQDHWVRIQGVWYRTAEADAGTEPPWPIADGRP
ncbi:MAG: hypothetical protein ACREMB_13115 [Candidatus Rokuibacteriota bacterium]